MSRCTYPHCNFQVSHESYLNLHMILEHSALMPGATQEMIQQLSAQIFIESIGVVNVKLMKNMPSMNYENAYQSVFLRAFCSS